MNIDNAEKKYWAQTQEDQKILKTYRIPAEINIVSELEQVAFYPNGDLDKVTITLINSEQRSINLTTKGVFSGVKLQTQQ